MSYLKQESTNGDSKQPEAETKSENGKTTVVVTGPDREPGDLSSASINHEINYVAGIDGIEASLDWIAKGLARLTNEDCTVNLGLAQGSNIYPIKLALAENDFDDTMGRVVTAFERIADSLARIDGLSRPRLEEWHEQDEYTPRYREAMGDRGAPGPKPEAAAKGKEECV